VGRLVGLVVIFIFFAGCTPFFGAKTVMYGCVRVPVALPGIDGDLEVGNDFPFPHAVVEIRGENGERWETVTDGQGKYQIEGVESQPFLLYARRGRMVVAQGVSLLSSKETRDLGVANCYTTAQVAIFEAASSLYEEAVYFRDIPHFTPSSALVTFVREAFLRQENPLEDPRVKEEAHRLIDVWFAQ